MSKDSDKTVESEDEKAIRQVSLDYVEGWYNGDAERMHRSIHTALVKRGIKRDVPSGREYLNYLTHEIMVLDTAEGFGTHVPEDQRVYDITILDISGEIASVRADSPDWIDHLHLAKLNGQWVIANAIYTANPNKQI